MKQKQLTFSRFYREPGIQGVYVPRGEAGFTLIELLIVIAIIGIIAAIAIPNLLSARRTSQETSAIAVVRTIVNAEALYFSSHGNNNVYGSMDELVQEKCVDSSLRDLSRNGYTFQITQPTSATYTVNATPEAAIAGQSRYFFTDESGLIREQLGSPASASSAPVNK